MTSMRGPGLPGGDQHGRELGMIRAIGHDYANFLFLPESSTR
jgi:hypothetical protein